MFDLDLLFQKSKLIPVIVQEQGSGEVLMLGFTDREAVERTLETKTAWFWSRSRQCLWNKGETSGNFLHVKEIFTDCDTDTLLYICVPRLPHGSPQLLFPADRDIMYESQGWRDMIWMVHWNGSTRWS